MAYLLGCQHKLQSCGWLYDGKIYSIPWYATSAITIYNKDLLNKSGINTLPKTYEDLFKMSAKIKEKTGSYSYLPTITENDTMIKILNKYGVSEIKDFNSVESQKLFEMFRNYTLRKETTGE